MTDASYCHIHLAGIWVQQTKQQGTNATAHYFAANQRQTSIKPGKVADESVKDISEASNQVHDAGNVCCALLRVAAHLSHALCHRVQIKSWHGMSHSIIITAKAFRPAAPALLLHVAFSQRDIRLLPVQSFSCCSATLCGWQITKDSIFIIRSRIDLQLQGKYLDGVAVLDADSCHVLQLAAQTTMHPVGCETTSMHPTRCAVARVQTVSIIQANAPAAA